VRSFAPDAPSKEHIVKIIRAGLLAPNAAQAVSGQDFRQFFVFQKGSPKLAQLAALAKRHVKRMAEQLCRELAANPLLIEKGMGFVKKDLSNSQRRTCHASAQLLTSSS
jgi:nitroreductase